MHIMVTVVGGLIVAVVVSLGSHIVKDIETRKEVEALKARVSKLEDG